MPLECYDPALSSTSPAGARNTNISVLLGIVACVFGAAACLWLTVSPIVQVQHSLLLVPGRLQQIVGPALCFASISFPCPLHPFRPPSRAVFCQFLTAFRFSQ